MSKLHETKKNKKFVPHEDKHFYIEKTAKGK